MKIISVEWSMESKAVTTVLSGCVLLVIFVSAGSSLEGECKN